MSDQAKRIPLRFFRTELGTEPVRDWLRALAKPDKALLGEGLKQLEYGWPIGMPLCRAVGRGLFELRVNLPGGRTARVLVVPFSGCLVAVHAFSKKTRTTPKADLNIARARQRALESKQ